LPAIAEEMHNFYEDEDFEYQEGSTPSLDMASMDGLTGAEDGLMLMTNSMLTEAATPDPPSSAMAAERGGGGGGTNNGKNQGHLFACGATV